MPRRPSTTAAQKLKVLEKCGAVVRCHCGEKGCEEVVPISEVQYDHDPPWAIAKKHSVEVLWPVWNPHHDLKTNGPPATSYGSDKHEIAKVKRIEKKRLADEALARGEAKAERMKPKRKIQNGTFKTNRGGKWKSQLGGKTVIRE